jgi:hypothetical protein
LKIRPHRALAKVKEELGDSVNISQHYRNACVGDESGLTVFGSGFWAAYEGVFSCAPL